MAIIPAQPAPDPTLAALRGEVEARAAAELPRPYLGMSSIGMSCERRLWYGFRWAAQEQFACDTLWRFEDGHRSEDVMAARLRLVPGVHLRAVDPRTGRQFVFADIGGHFRGHADGMVTGLLQAPKALHVWEAKAVNEAKLAKLDKLRAERGEKQALAEWDAVYHAQAILYMAYAEAPRHYLTASTPGARAMTSVRTDTDLDAARRLREKAERIITAAEPPTRISEDPAWWECKFCPMATVCHQGALPAVNCRTCAHATPELIGDGRWSCAFHKRDLTVEEQRAGCPSHRYIPALVSFAEAVDADAAANWIEYRLPDGRTFRNGEHGAGSYSSEELRAADPALIGDPGAEALRSTFDASQVPGEPPAAERPDPFIYRWVHGHLGRYVPGAAYGGKDMHQCWLQPGHPDYERAKAQADAAAGAPAGSALEPPKFWGAA